MAWISPVVLPLPQAKMNNKNIYQTSGWVKLRTLISKYLKVEFVLLFKLWHHHNLWQIQPIHYSIFNSVHYLRGFSFSNCSVFSITYPHLNFVERLLLYTSFKTMSNTDFCTERRVQTESKGSLNLLNNLYLICLLEILSWAHARFLYILISLFNRLFSLRIYLIKACISRLCKQNQTELNHTYCKNKSAWNVLIIFLGGGNYKFFTVGLLRTPRKHNGVALYWNTHQNLMNKSL